jgi:hypothetical protein
LPGSPDRIEREIRTLGLERIIAKRRDSMYEPGERTDAWVKVKFNQHQEFVIGGYKPDGATFDSILVGYYKGKDLHYAAKVRAGFTPRVKGELLAAIAKQPARTCPFVNLPNSAGRSHWGEGITTEDMAALRWVKPTIVVEVGFVEWTAGRLAPPSAAARSTPRQVTAGGSSRVVGDTRSRFVTLTSAAAREPWGSKSPPSRNFGSLVSSCSSRSLRMPQPPHDERGSLACASFATVTPGR